MAEVGRSEATLRFMGDDLDPDEITALLGMTPTRGVRKGGLWKTPSGREVVARSGSWRLRVPCAAPGDIDVQVFALLADGTKDLDRWRGLAGRYDGQFFIGLFLDRGNEGIGIRAETLETIGSRGLSLELDIYKLDTNEDDG